MKATTTQLMFETILTEDVPEEMTPVLVLDAKEEKELIDQMAELIMEKFQEEIFQEGRGNDER